MNNRTWIVIFALILASCNLTALEPTATPAPPSTPMPASPTPNVSTPTLVPIETLLAEFRRRIPEGV